ncbi:histidine kinase [Clostridiales bacterium PH28_bin88]|nr:histidine kinase [Clostridiales bacterium PH28_bin88]
MDPIKLLLVDDHTVLRSGLKLLVGAQPDMQVVGEAAGGDEALRLVKELKPDVVILDLSMPGTNGLQVLEEILEISPATKILVLTMHEDEEYLRRVLRSGGKGYILKKAADVELLSAIRAVHRGEVFIEPSMAKTLVNALFETATVALDKKKEQGLSEREKEVLRLVALGYTNQQVANSLMISVKTVESHKARIKDKLNIYRRSDLVRYAMQHGLVPNK